MSHDPDRRKFFALHEPVRRRDAAAGAGQLVRVAVFRVGGRRPGVLPADRFLVRSAGRGHRGQEGVPDEPGRRRRPAARDLPDVQGAGNHLVRGRFRRDHARSRPGT